METTLLLFLGQNIIPSHTQLKAAVGSCLHDTAYSDVGSLQYTVKWAAANFIVCYILYLVCLPILQEKKKSKSKNRDYTKSSLAPGFPASCL